MWLLENVSSPTPQSEHSTVSCQKAVSNLDCELPKAGKAALCVHKVRTALTFPPRLFIVLLRKNHCLCSWRKSGAFVLWIDVRWIVFAEPTLPKPASAAQQQILRVTNWGPHHYQHPEVWCRLLHLSSTDGCWKHFSKGSAGGYWWWAVRNSYWVFFPVKSTLKAV